MHNIYIRAQKDSLQQWTNLPFIATDDVIFIVLETWPTERCAPDLAEMEKAATQKKKDDAKLHITQLAERRQNKKAATKVRVARNAA